MGTSRSIRSNKLPISACNAPTFALFHKELQDEMSNPEMNNTVLAVVRSLIKSPHINQIEIDYAFGMTIQQIT
jgi:hypothetical protein